MEDRLIGRLLRATLRSLKGNQLLNFPTTPSRCRRFTRADPSTPQPRCPQRFVKAGRADRRLPISGPGCKATPERDV
ncbi:hypothetical protein V5799_031545 [Amblyomma americanum]|uniref:Uncharacterized protein n=1 Tax=Amblyomma americanum TaxID=6943 RepID=A0AAQ4EKC2_AMBAM